MIIDEAGLRLEIARLESTLKLVTDSESELSLKVTEMQDKLARIERYAFGAGMALIGVTPDVLIAQDLIGQILEETP